MTLEEVNSQIALEYGQAMTVRVLKADGEVMRKSLFSVYMLFKFAKPFILFWLKKSEKSKTYKLLFFLIAIVVVQNATVLDLKKAIRRFMELKQQREGGVKHISW